MTTLYIDKHPIGLTLYTRLPEYERNMMGDIRMLLIEGERYGGLSFGQLAHIAATTGRIESDDLPEMT